MWSSKYPEICVFFFLKNFNAPKHLIYQLFLPSVLVNLLFVSTAIIVLGICDLYMWLVHVSLKNDSRCPITPQHWRVHSRWDKGKPFELLYSSRKSPNKSQKNLKFFESKISYIPSDTGYLYWEHSCCLWSHCPSGGLPDRTRELKCHGALWLRQLFFLD